MKSIYAIAVVPIVAGAIGACNGAHPGPSADPSAEPPIPGAGTPGPQPNFGEPEFPRIAYSPIFYERGENTP